jgi:hypothetical protein
VPGQDEPPDVRWVVLHMIEETARYAGHLDIARELLDARPGSGRADRPDAIPFREPVNRGRAKSATSVQLRISLIKVGSVPARA